MPQIKTNKHFETSLSAYLSIVKPLYTTTYCVLKT